MTLPSDSVFFFRLVDFHFSVVPFIRTLRFGEKSIRRKLERIFFWEVDIIPHICFSIGGGSKQLRIFGEDDYFFFVGSTDISYSHVKLPSWNVSYLEKKELIKMDSLHLRFCSYVS